MAPQALDANDLRFTRYRLSVVSSWPDSDLKAATLAAIRSRLSSLEGGNPGNKQIYFVERRSYDGFEQRALRLVA